MKYEDMLRENAKEARRRNWVLKQWIPYPALRTIRYGRPFLTKFTGQKYNPKKAEVIENGWDHEHCWFCDQSICNCGSENCVPEGYTDGDQWICCSCYQKIIVNGKDPNSICT